MNGRYKDLLEEQSERAQAVSALKDASIEFEEMVNIVDLLNESLDKVSELITLAVERANSYNGVIEEGSISDPISLDEIVSLAGDMENLIVAFSEEIVSNVGKIDGEIQKLRNS